MSSQFHNRLIGTVVLVALGVIFLPDILDGKKERQEEVFSEIPLRPQLENNQAQVEAQKPIEIVVNSDSTGEKPLAAQPKQERVSLPAQTNSGKNSTTSASAKEKSAVAKVIKQKETSAISQPISTSSSQSAKTVNQPASRVKSAAKKDEWQVAWTLQLGSFNHAGNVRALVAKLRKAGITAYTLPAKPVDGKLTKVFVGPDVSKEKLKARQAQVFKVTKLKGRIVSYNPLDK